MPYVETPLERQRIDDLMRVLPKGRASILEIGARDGHITRLLSERFSQVTALDLTRPTFDIPHVTNIAGDATNLPFENASFDCVFCTEVLEHIPDVGKACSEIARVAKADLVVGVPFQQDLGAGCTTCQSCGKTNPPWGHINSFSEQRLLDLFPAMKLVSKSFVGESRQSTSALSRFLMKAGGNPWGTYDQDEPCVHCGAKLVRPERRTFFQRICGAVALRLNSLIAATSAPHGNWIHLVFSRNV